MPDEAAWGWRLAWQQVAGADHDSGLLEITGNYRWAPTAILSKFHSAGCWRRMLADGLNFPAALGHVDSYWYGISWFGLQGWLSRREQRSALVGFNFLNQGARPPKCNRNKNKEVQTTYI
ncbi:MAG: hypothetical protein K0U74_09050 [Alphaproteobacteria bacterium]|nr:hypothetical protein [Alphaproteobacteria bacterium]